MGSAARCEDIQYPQNSDRRPGRPQRPKRPLATKNASSNPRKTSNGSPRCTTRRKRLRCRKRTLLDFIASADATDPIQTDDGSAGATQKTDKPARLKLTGRRVHPPVSLAQAGATVVDMRVAGRWKSSQMPAHYAKAELAERCARIMLLYLPPGYPVEKWAS